MRSEKQIKYSNLLRTNTCEVFENMNFDRIFSNSRFPQNRNNQRNSLDLNNLKNTWKCSTKIGLNKILKNKRSNCSMGNKIRDEQNERNLCNHQRVYIFKKKGQYCLSNNPNNKKPAKFRIKTQQIDRSSEKNKIKKGTIFGLENIDVSIVDRLKSRKDVNTLFMSTSNNTFFNNHFLNTNSKKKIDRMKQKILNDNKNFKDEFQNDLIKIKPKITTMSPQKIDFNIIMSRKKKIQKLYTTNSNQFSFIRSKTDDIQINKLCGWEEDQNEVGQNLSDSFYI